MNTEKQIEFDKVKEIWSSLTVTGYAKEQIADVACILDETELRKQLRDTTNSRKMIEKLGAPPLQNVTEMKEILTAAGRGDCLTPYQLERVEKVLALTQRLKEYLARGKQDANPLAYYDENLDGLEDLREEIARQIRYEAVDDRASKALYEIRMQIADRKIWINHKRVRLHVKAEELYPEDYDFSIIFDSVKNRKIRHDMERKFTDEVIRYDGEEKKQ